MKSEFSTWWRRGYGRAWCWVSTKRWLIGGARCARRKSTSHRRERRKASSLPELALRCRRFCRPRKVSLDLRSPPPRGNRGQG
eukprot:156147-Amphidinium_carterae.1